MKYGITHEVVPQSMREEINKKIEYIVNHNLSEEETGVTKEDIFNAYTGKGGLHGLHLSNFDNYSSYQKAKGEVEQGQFFTPYPLVEWVYGCLHISDTDLIADLTSGHGAFASCAPIESNFYGCEVDIQAYRVSRYLYPEAHMTHTDIRDYMPGVTFDYILGNPPFHLSWKIDGEYYSSELYYCLRAAELLKPAGILAVIVPMSFCADEFTDGGKIQLLNERFNYICQIGLREDTFAHLGVTDYPTKLLILQKKSKYLEDSFYNTDVLELTNPDFLWFCYLQPATIKRQKIKQKVLLEMMQETGQEKEWIRKVQKLLYDIKRHPVTRPYYAECLEFFQKFQTQKKPDYMNYDEWQKVKLKPEDVMKKLKATLQRQNPKKSKTDRLVKNSYTVSYNGAVSDINSLILGEDSFPKEEPWLRRLIARKQKEYYIQSQPFADMEQDPLIAEWLDNLVFIGDDKKIRLNPMQKKDINLFLQKRYSYIQWEQGSGKTLAGIAIGKYRMEMQHMKNVFVVSTAISIKNNWVDVLTDFSIPFQLIESVADIRMIVPGTFVLITLNIITKLYKQLRRYIKSICQKTVLIFDEGDSISNMDSKQTKAVLTVFRKLRFKTSMSGTCTRNNISEFYPQMELLYNNSINMISTCQMIKKYNKDNKIVEEANPFYGCPYPAYKDGFKLFTASHIPEKITVFGIGQYNQDIYHADELRKILDKTVITRTFEEISGKDLYEILQESCPMGFYEASVYEAAIHKFYEMEYLFRTTGNARKDAMLRVLNQLLLLLRICAAPQTLKEYKGALPEKFKAVLSLVRRHGSECIAIGVRHINVANAYADAVRAAFPDRPVFLITGKEATLRKRKEIVKKLKDTENGILISTQQSLSASMNIDFVNVCIIPELHWNNASMSQYYFRFIRYTSTEHKKVYFVTYEQSIESNLLKMVLVKDKLNLFMKDQEVTDEELYERFGIDAAMLENLMYKEKTEDGTVIRWGNQKIS